MQKCAFNVDVIGKMKHVVALFEWHLWEQRSEADLQAMAQKLGLDLPSDTQKAILIDRIRRVDADLLYEGLRPT